MFYASFFIKLEIISIEGRDPPNHLFSLQSKSRLGGNRSIQSLVYNAILVRIVRTVQRLQVSFKHELQETRSDLENNIDKVRDDTIVQIQAVESRVESLEQIKPPNVDGHLKLVIRNLPFTENEDLCDKVNSFMNNELSLPGLELSNITRTVPRSNRYPGVVLVSCRSVEDRDKILTAKKT